MEVWKNENYINIRQQIIDDIASIELCKYCDSKHYK